MLVFTTTLFALSSVALARGGVTLTASNYESQFLSETNSLGVVTGQPTVVTSQPAVATYNTVSPPISSMPPIPTIAPVPINMTTTVVPPPTNISTTHIIPPPSRTSGSGPGSSSSPTIPPANGGSQLQAAGISFLGLGALALAML